MDASVQHFSFSQYQPASILEEEIIRLEATFGQAQSAAGQMSDRDIAVLRRQLADARRRKAADVADDVDKDMRQWIVEDDIHFDLENAKFRRRDRSEEWQLVPAASILASRPVSVTYGEEAIKLALRKMGRVVARAAYLETLPPSDVLNMMDFSCVLAPATGGYDPIFDTLLLSLAGVDGADGVVYIERWLVARWNLIQQRKSGAYRMPALVFDNDDGGAGKNVFAERFLATLFGKRLAAGNMRISELTGDYNDNLKGKAVVMVNEVSFDKTDTERLKQVLGSKTLRVNPKHQAVREDENVTAFILAGNAHGRTVKLTGTEIDRRYSVLVTRPTDTLKLHVAAQEGLDPLGADYDRTIDQAMDRLLAAFDDREKVARWLGSMIAKHGDITTIEPFHREGYRIALEVQESAVAGFLSLAFSPSFEAASVADLYDAYCTYARDWGRERDILTRKAFSTAAKRFAQKRFPDLVMRKAGRKHPMTGSQSNWFFANAGKTVEDCSMSDIEARL